MAIDEFLETRRGVASRRDLLAVVSRAQFDDEVRRGHLVAVFPRVYARPWDADLDEIRRRAAIESVGGQDALSHLTALLAWNLPAPLEAPLHVTAYQPRHPRGIPGELVVHRTLRPLDAIELQGIPVVRAATAIATSWPLLSGSDQRAPAIIACRKRLVSASRLASLAEEMWWLPQRRELRWLVSALLAGVESELELWGYASVFTIPGLDHHARRQLRISGANARHRLDTPYLAEKVTVELDGRAYHASTEQWERDIQRDLDLAKVGWQTIRLSHRRLTTDVLGCQRDVLAVLASRRAMAGVGPVAGRLAEEPPAQGPRRV